MKRTLSTLAALVCGLLVSTSAFADKHGPAKFELDKAHTNVGFSVKHLMVSTVKGRFNTFEGGFMFDEKGKKVTDVVVSIDTASVDTNNKDRDDHLRNPDFFDATKPGHEKMTFKAKEFSATPGKALTVKGDLTIKGQTKPVTLTGKFLGVTKNPFTSMPKVAFELTAKINRKDWGLNWNKALDGGGVVVSDEVQITIEAQADQAKPAEAPKKG
jgi:polyisoprenoid-binding protein YceI